MFSVSPQLEAGRRVAARFRGPTFRRPAIVPAAVRARRARPVPIRRAAGPRPAPMYAAGAPMLAPMPVLRPAPFLRPGMGEYGEIATLGKISLKKGIKSVRTVAKITRAAVTGQRKGLTASEVKKSRITRKVGIVALGVGGVSALKFLPSSWGHAAYAAVSSVGLAGGATAAAKAAQKAKALKDKVHQARKDLGLPPLTLGQDAHIDSVAASAAKAAEASVTGGGDTSAAVNDAVNAALKAEADKQAAQANADAQRKAAEQSAAAGAAAGGGEAGGEQAAAGPAAKPVTEAGIPLIAKLILGFVAAGAVYAAVKAKPQKA